MASSHSDGGLTIWKCSSASVIEQDTQLAPESIVVGLGYKGPFLIAGLLDGRVMLYNRVCRERPLQASWLLSVQHMQQRSLRTWHCAVPPARPQHERCKVGVWRKATMWETGFAGR